MVKVISFTVVLSTLALVASLNIAHACTDWKAVAAFDAVILEHARNVVLDERIPEVAASVEKLCKALNKTFEAASDRANKSGNPEDRTLADQRLKQALNCDSAEVAYRNALTDLSLDRDHALADNCSR